MGRYPMEARDFRAIVLLLAIEKAQPHSGWLG